MSENSTEVLIIGAGSVGLFAALSLARLGVPFRIVDKVAYDARLSKAISLQARMMEILDQMDLAKKFQENGVATLNKAIRFFSKGTMVATLPYLGSVRSDYPFLLFIPQWKTEQYLREELENVYHKQVETGWELTDFVQSNDQKVISTLKSASGEIRKFESKFLLGCDGAHSFVRKKLGAKFDGVTIETKWGLCDIIMDTDLPSRDETTIFWHSDAMLAIAKIDINVHRVFVKLDHETSQEELSKASLMELINRLTTPYTVHAKEILWHSTYNVNERMVDQTVVGRVILAGDAAHIHSPWGAQGLNTGMQDAFNIAWKLNLILKGVGNPDVLLKSYVDERVPVARGVLKGTSALRQFFTLESGWLSFLRDWIFPPLSKLPIVYKTFFDNMSQLLIAYPQGLLTEKPLEVGYFKTPITAIKNGQRVPNAVLSKRSPGGRQLIKIFEIFKKNPGAYHLFIWASNSGMLDFEPYLALAKKHNRSDFTALQVSVICPTSNGLTDSPFEVYEDSGDFVEQYKPSHSVFFLVRPDNYLAAANSVSGHAIIATYMNRIILSND
ncbi:hypothetical protein K493DRAFT_404891 [Basidiobolus meristosporus CBS 931.73]|uniref:FAD-binding domain-containing protein n=1 Tax=Basidiobolus meristosporus CBS 931.73 TaxID=1314790 RepID=A0A1Y1Z1I3_9FUNG|nr:hypothetical protein K493DRAFT_404891 [Basidiobolus meristosporus CBS 931.73]|eukprot:ORY03807.1 hypothetical protein K493DRAFT_404891 [Basidiobolus meristosporus CBS 931.73]